MKLSDLFIRKRTASTTNNQSEDLSNQPNDALSLMPMVKRFAKRLSRLGAPADDLFQDGMVAAINIERNNKYDPSRNVPFESYASRRIIGAMLTSLANERNRLGFSEINIRHILRLDKAFRNAENLGLSNEESINYVIDKFKDSAKPVTKEHLTFALEILNILQTAVDVKDCETKMPPKIAEKPQTPQDVLIHDERLHQLDSAIEKLPKIDQQLVKLRHGRTGEKPLKHAELVERLGISDKTVRRRLINAYAQLRTEMEIMDEINFSPKKLTVYPGKKPSRSPRPASPPRPR